MNWEYRIFSHRRRISCSHYDAATSGAARRMNPFTEEGWVGAGRFHRSSIARRPVSASRVPPDVGFNKVLYCDVAIHRLGTQIRGLHHIMAFTRASFFRRPNLSEYTWNNCHLHIKCSLAMSEYTVRICTVGRTKRARRLASYSFGFEVKYGFGMSNINLLVHGEW